MTNLRVKSKTEFPQRLSDKLRHELYQKWNFLGAPLLVQTSNKKIKSIFDNLSVEELLAQTAEWGRHDIRLLEAILAWLWENWRKVNPILLNEMIRSKTTPAVWGILKEWSFLRKNQMSEPYQAFWVLVTEGLPKSDERYFYSEGKIRPFHLARRQLAHRLDLFERWGFIGHDLPSIQGWKNLNYELTQNERHRILRYLASKGPFNLDDYLRELDFKISRQTAWRDLSSSSFLKRKGRTKSALYYQK